MTKPDFLLDIPEDVYHADTKAGMYLTSHMLGIFRRSPLLYSFVANGLELPGSKAYDVGRAAHCMILEGSGVYSTRYTTGGPINPRTGKVYGRETQAFAAWIDSQPAGKRYISEDEHELVCKMAMGVRACTPAMEILDMPDTYAEATIRTHVGDFPVQARLDLVHISADRQSIVDLKTCESLDNFDRDFNRYGYAYQLAWYADVLSHAQAHQESTRDTSLVLVPSVFVIAVEKSAPNAAGVWRLKQDDIVSTIAENHKLLEELRECIETDEWPTRYDTIRTIERFVK